MRRVCVGSVAWLPAPGLRVVRIMLRPMRPLGTWVGAARARQCDGQFTGGQSRHVGLKVKSPFNMLDLDCRSQSASALSEPGVDETGPLWRGQRVLIHAQNKVGATRCSKLLRVRRRKLTPRHVSVLVNVFGQGIVLGCTHELHQRSYRLIFFSLDAMWLATTKTHDSLPRGGTDSMVPRRCNLR
mmetsp:Transcript_3451/g.11016  ORF Transcript_3451/g.11016 Transcript_3451/m.11016 type:complete len:185 (-) Transcript_3451:206-760(-)